MAISLRPMAEEDLPRIGAWLGLHLPARWPADRLVPVVSLGRRPDEEAAMGARDGEAGMDYAIGDPACIGHGTGTGLPETRTGAGS